MKTESVRSAVRARYGAIAEETCENGCGCGCGSAATGLAEALGYTPRDFEGVPGEANLGLGSGNPLAEARLEPGHTVLDLGSGGGLDCFIAAGRVGPSGHVIGVDMTPQMVERARETARERGFENVEFRLGEVEALPVPDGSVDVVISNCVLNLSPDRPRALREAFRVLRAGGQLVVSDLVCDHPVPGVLREQAELATACLPVLRDTYVAELETVGFQKVEIAAERNYPDEALSTTPVVREVLAARPDLESAIRGFADSVHGAVIKAIKP